MPDIGAVLGARYRVIALLGEGGMGAVYRAENIVTGKLVALKWMHPQLAVNSDARERLLREARAASRLSHPNVVDVYDVVQDGPTFFLVMELLQGETLRSYLDRAGKRDLHEFIALLLPALSGVIAAHECGVIHRDLKPDNIFLARVSGSRALTTKVLDFGVAKLATNPGLTLTQTGAAIGTPLYMSLEQLRGDRDIDARTDVYAFGVMLYEAMTGEMPHQATTLAELAIKVATLDPRPVKSLRPDIPSSLARLVDWSLVRERAQRLPDLRTLHSELESFATEARFRRQMTEPDGVTPALFAKPIAPELRAQRVARGTQAVAAVDNQAGPWAAPAAAAQPQAAAAAGVDNREGSVGAVPSDTLTARELSRGRRGFTVRSKSSWWLAALATTGLGTAAALYVSTLPDVTGPGQGHDVGAASEASTATGSKPASAASSPAPARLGASSDGAPPIVLNVEEQSPPAPTPEPQKRPANTARSQSASGQRQDRQDHNVGAVGAKQDDAPRSGASQGTVGSEPRPPDESRPGVTSGPRRDLGAGQDVQRSSAARKEAVQARQGGPRESAAPAANVNEDQVAPAAPTARKEVVPVRKPAPARSVEPESQVNRDGVVKEAPRKKTATELVGF